MCNAVNGISCFCLINLYISASEATALRRYRSFIILSYLIIFSWSGVGVALATPGYAPALLKYPQLVRSRKPYRTEGIKYRHVENLQFFPTRVFNTPAEVPLGIGKSAHGVQKN